jgi:hypothetical protein
VMNYRCRRRQREPNPERHDVRPHQQRTEQYLHMSTPLTDECNIDIHFEPITNRLAITATKSFKIRNRSK